MAKKTNNPLVVGLDVGTSKIAALVGEVGEDQQIHIIGVGTQPSRGLKRGVVVNIESTVQSMQRALQEAELMAGCEVHSAFTGISGSHIHGLNSHGIVPIRDREVSEGDVERVLDAAKAVAIPADQQILHVLPQEYIIDNQGNIRQPIGMSGVRLEAKVHMVAGAVSAAQNIVKCVRACGLQVNDIILEQLASSHAVLTDDEKELGVCLVDIGGGTTDIAIFTDGAIRHTAVIPIAGDQVTNDVAVALRTPTQAAEQIKIDHAYAMVSAVEEDQEIEVPGLQERQGRTIRTKALAQVVEARYEELLALVQAELRRSGFEHLIAAGIVLTGGGVQVKGLLELAERVFRLPVRIGTPHGVTGLESVIDNSIYATGIGLLIHAARKQSGEYNDMTPFHPNHDSVWQRMKSWFHGQF